MAKDKVICEKGVPVPTASRGRKAQSDSKYSWNTMEIGDSRFIPGGSTKSVSSAVHAARKRHNFNLVTRTYTHEKHGPGVGIFRMADSVKSENTE
jgi:hypothetical protein